MTKREKFLCIQCNTYKEIYTKYPQIICVDCISIVPVSFILETLSISYHEAISTTIKLSLPQKCYNDRDYAPAFWCTTDKSGLLKGAELLRIP